MKELTILRRRVRNLRRCLKEVASDIHLEARMNEGMGQETSKFMCDLDRRIHRTMSNDDKNEIKQAVLRRAKMQDPV